MGGRASRDGFSVGLGCIGGLRKWKGGTILYDTAICYFQDWGVALGYTYG